LDAVDRLGWELVGVIDPSDFKTAHRMIADGQADIILAASQSDLPSVALASDAGAPPNQRRCRILLRPIDEDVSPRQRRPQRTQRLTAPLARGQSE